MYKLYNPDMQVKEGDIFLVSISTILETWISGDGGSPDVLGTGQSKWDSVLEGKRDDYGYADLVESLKTDGFKCPLTAQLPNPEGVVPRKSYSFSDGHHRLAAAIELGMTHIPIRFTKNWTSSIYFD